MTGSSILRPGRLVALAVIAAVAAAAGGLAAAAPALRAAPAAPAATEAKPAAPTYRDVAPILLGKCAGCHMRGGIAPFPLTSAKDAIPRAKLILAVTQTGSMPPWMPGRDSPAYIGETQRKLTAKEKETIRLWVQGGARR